MVPALIENRNYRITPTALNPAPNMFPTSGIYLGIGTTPNMIRIQFDGNDHGMSVNRTWFTFELIGSRSRSRSRSQSRSRSKSKNRNINKNRNRTTHTSNTRKLIQ